MSRWPDVSHGTAQRISETFREQGRAWLRDLPDVVRVLAERWHLTPAGKVFPGARASFVAPVVDRVGHQCVLKVVPDVLWLRYEYNALAYWDGRGAVRVTNADLSLGALLLERLNPGQSLAAARETMGDGVQIFVSVASQLAEDHDSSPELPHLESWLTKLDDSAGGATMPELEAERRSARQLSATLFARSASFRALHGDLHHGNLLRDGTAWSAIDPKGLIGPLEAEPAAFLRNPRREIINRPDGAAWTIERARTIAKGLDCGHDLVLGWAYILGVLSAQWSLEDGEDLEDAGRWLRCALILKQAYELQAS